MPYFMSVCLFYFYVQYKARNSCCSAFQQNHHIALEVLGQILSALQTKCSPECLDLKFEVKNSYIFRHLLAISKSAILYFSVQRVGNGPLVLIRSNGLFDGR